MINEMKREMILPPIMESQEDLYAVLKTERETPRGKRERERESWVTQKWSLCRSLYIVSVRGVGKKGIGLAVKRVETGTALF